MPTIKLVALDLDGTLLNAEYQIAPRARAAITAARERGVRFVIVTGRMHQSAMMFARDLALDGMPLVSYNGAMVREYPSGRQIFHDPVPLEAAKKLAVFCEAHGYYLQAYVDDRLYVAEINETCREYAAIAKVEATPVGSLFLWMNAAPTKLLIIEPKERMPQIQAEVRELLGPTVMAAPSKPHYLEIVNGQVSKGAALAAIAADLSIPREEVAAMGDGMNDLSMVAWAGTGVAMGHAPEPLRRVAAIVAQTDDGVAEALERMGLTGANQG